MANMPIEQRINISLAAQRYMRANERFQQLLLELEESFRDLQQQLEPASRSLLELDYKYFLLETDAQRNIHIEELNRL